MNGVEESKATLLFMLMAGTIIIGSLIAWNAANLHRIRYEDCMAMTVTDLQAKCEVLR